ncbi:MAG: hypothetical protein ACP5J5_07815, partial [Dissulfurimicrobium sp.]
MGTRSKVGGRELFYLKLLGEVLEVEAYWKDGYLIRLDLRMRSRERPDGEIEGIPPSGLKEGLMAVLDGADPRNIVPAEVRGSLFQIKVWTALLTAAPYATVLTYGGFAERLGCGSPRSVGQALK